MNNCRNQCVHQKHHIVKKALIVFSGAVAPVALNKESQPLKSGLCCQATGGRGMGVIFVQYLIVDATERGQTVLLTLRWGGGDCPTA